MSRPPKRSTVAADRRVDGLRVADVAGDPEPALETEVVAAARRQA